MDTFKETLFTVALSLSFGLVFGSIGSAIGTAMRKKRAARAAPATPATPAPERVERYHRLAGAVIRFFTKSIYLVLGVGLIWTLYFLVLGLADPGLTEYSANGATLIVSVVTIFSIMIAFYEFTHRGEKK